MTTETVAPNAPESTASTNNAVPSLDSIAAKMTAMRQQTQRNLLRDANGETETGASGEEGKAESPVAPDGVEQSAQPEVASESQAEAASTAEEPAQDEPVSETQEADTTSQEIIDFIEFAEENPNAKFRFMRNGKEMIIDAKRAAAILGQGGAIHEEARQLKVEKAEFEEYLKEARAKTEGLLLTMEFTVEPRLQKAYDEIVKTQGYQATFQQQMARTTDPAEQARIRAGMTQNERYIAQQSEVIRSLKPQVDQFRNLRQQQVREIIENNRRSFSDKELRNEYVFNEIREKVSKNWAGAEQEIIPGIKNIDLISSDETILGLIRDGLKFRDRPSTKSAGASIAQLQSKRGGSTGSVRGDDENLNKLREQAKTGDKKAGDNLLMARLNQLRQARTR